MRIKKVNMDLWLKTVTFKKIYLQEIFSELNDMQIQIEKVQWVLIKVNKRDPTQSTY